MHRGFVKQQAAPLRCAVAGPAPHAGSHQAEFGELKLDCINEEPEWCAPSHNKDRSVSRKLDKTSAFDASQRSSDCTTAHTRAEPSSPAAGPVEDARRKFKFVPLHDDDFLCCPEDLAAARNMWQKAMYGSLARIGRCEAHPWVTQEKHLEAPISSLYLALDLV